MRSEHARAVLGGGLPRPRGGIRSRQGVSPLQCGSGTQKVEGGGGGGGGSRRKPSGGIAVQAGMFPD